MKKRCFAAICLCLCALFLFLPLPALAGGDVPREGRLTDTVDWELTEDGILSLTGTGAAESGGGSPWLPLISEIREIRVGEGITHIGADLFSGEYALYDHETDEFYSVLEKVVLPSTLESVGPGAFFYGWDGGIDPIEVHIPSLKDWFEIEFDGTEGRMDTPTSYASSPVEGYLYAGGVMVGETVEFPKELTKVGACSFSGLCNLKKVILHEGVTEIGNGAFQGCHWLETVVLPDGLKKIGNGAFQGCANLKIDLPPSLESVGVEAFCGCTGLESITLPASLRHLGAGAFDKCKNIKEVRITDLDAYCRIDTGDNRDGAGLSFVASSPVYYAERLLLNGKPVTEVTFPEGTISVGHALFENCKDLVKVTFPESVEHIGRNAFAGCENLEEVSKVYPKVVENYAFAGCKKLKAFNVSYVAYIGEGAFAGCESLTSVAIYGAGELGANAFAGCTGLRCVTVEAPGALSPYLYGMDWLKEADTVILTDKVAYKEDRLQVLFEGFELLNTADGTVAYSKCSHDWEVLRDSSPDDCLFPKHCLLCDCRLTVITHTPSEWTVILGATATDPGKKQINCTVCGEVLETEIIPPIEKQEDDVSGDTSGEVSDETSDNTSHGESGAASATESKPGVSKAEDPSEQTDSAEGVPLWTVFLAAALGAGISAGIALFFRKKK